MLKPIDTIRLKQLKADLKLLNLRFPVVEIANRMNGNKGNTSAYLSGKKPMSEQFLKKFYKTFKEDLAKAKRRKSPGRKSLPAEKNAFQRIEQMLWINQSYLLTLERRIQLLEDNQ